MVPRCPHTVPNADSTTRGARLGASASCDLALARLASNSASKTRLSAASSGIKLDLFERGLGEALRASVDMQPPEGGSVRRSPISWRQGEPLQEVVPRFTDARPGDSA